MQRIVVIGDNHSQLFANNPNFKRGLWSDSSLENFFDVRWIGPVTYWRLCRDQKSFIDFNTPLSYTPYPGMTVFTKCESNQHVMLSLGEIDIRSNILKHYNEDYEKGIDDMLGKIQEFVAQNKQDIRLHLISIIPPIRMSDCESPNSEFPFIGTDEERSGITKYFNKGLKKIAESNDVGYFDLYGIYSDDQGMLIPDYSDKIVHAIKIPQLETYIKNYFNI